MLTVEIAQADGGTLGIETVLVIASATGQNYREPLQDVDYLRISTTGSTEVDEI
jgi:hypothetical protein